MNHIESASKQLPESLLQTLKTAGAYDELRNGWIELGQALALNDKEVGSLKRLLFTTMSCFLKAESPACDSAVKAIFENEKHLQALQEFGIPAQFLLQCVRVGALKGYLSQAEQQPGNAITFFYGSDADVDGFMWANEKLVELARKQQEEKKVQENLDRERLKVRMFALLIKLRSGGELTPEELPLKKELREDISLKLKALKGLLESTSVLGRFFADNRNQSMTPELFETISQINKRDKESRGRTNDFPLSLLDPSSPWFYVMQRNNQKTLGEMSSSLYCNMGDWFEL
jgi:hypothetical protein